MYHSLLIIFVTGFLIYFSGKRFAKNSSLIGDYFNLSGAVKGATLDAIAGSFPELMIALFSVIFFGKFDVGVGVVAGSVLFNTMIIPSIAVLVSPVVFKVSREVMARDTIFFNISIFAFLTALLYSPIWGLSLGAIFVGAYFWYVNLIINQTKVYQTNHKKNPTEIISAGKEIIVAIFDMFVMGVAAYFLTKHAILLSQALGIPAFIIGFSVVAITTSVPNSVIAFINARKGRADDVVSNVFGSNIFTIFICLGLPLFLASIINGQSIQIVFEGKELIFSLLLATILIDLFTIDDYIITKINAIFMIFAYISFILFLFF